MAVIVCQKCGLTYSWEKKKPCPYCGSNNVDYLQKRKQERGANEAGNVKPEPAHISDLQNDKVGK